MWLNFFKRSRENFPVLYVPKILVLEYIFSTVTVLRSVFLVNMSVQSYIEQQEKNIASRKERKKSPIDIWNIKFLSLAIVMTSY